MGLEGFLSGILLPTKGIFVYGKAKSLTRSGELSMII